MKSLRHFYFILYLFSCGTALGQSSPEDYFKKYTVNGLSINSGYTFGSFTNGYTFSNKGNVLERRFIDYGDYYSANWDWSVKMNYRFKNKYAFEAGCTKSQMDFAFADKAFDNFISDSSYFGEFNFSQNYIAPSISAYYFHSLPAASRYLMSLYVSGGINFNINTNKLFLTSGPFYSNTAQQHINGTEDLNFTIHASPFFIQCYMESGINFCLYRCNLFLGAKYSFSQNMMTGNYQHLQNGTVTYSDQVHAQCNYLSATFRLGYILFQNWEKQRTSGGPDFKTKYIKPKY